MRIEVMRRHTKSLDANEKLIQTRSHVRNAIASRERQVVMRKVKSTITANEAFSIHAHMSNATCAIKSNQGFCGQDQKRR